MTDFSATLLSGFSSLNVKVFNRSAWLNCRDLYLALEKEKFSRATSFNNTSRSLWTGLYQQDRKSSEKSLLYSFNISLNLFNRSILGSCFIFYFCVLFSDLSIMQTHNYSWKGSFPKIAILHFRYWQKVSLIDKSCH